MQQRALVSPHPDAATEGTRAHEGRNFYLRVWWGNLHNRPCTTQLLFSSETRQQSRKFRRTLPSSQSIICPRKPFNGSVTTVHALLPGCEPSAGLSTNPELGTLLRYEGKKINIAACGAYNSNHEFSPLLHCSSRSTKPSACKGPSAMQRSSATCSPPSSLYSGPGVMATTFRLSSRLLSQYTLNCCSITQQYWV